MNVNLLPPARQELEDAFEWYESQKSGLGREFLADVDEGIRRVVAWPESAGRIMTVPLRRCLLRRFPYGLIYGLEENAIIVVALAHLHRKPFYWRGRLKRQH